jgi:hypothetical protein
MRRWAAVALALLAGCDTREPTVIDGSSPEAFEQSVYEARRDLPDADRLVFDRAIRTVGGRWHGADDQDRHARVTFNGMTAAQVVADQKARETGGQQ